MGFVDVGLISTHLASQPKATHVVPVKQDIAAHGLKPGSHMVRTPAALVAILLVVVEVAAVVVTPSVVVTPDCLGELCSRPRGFFDGAVVVTHLASQPTGTHTVPIMQSVAAQGL
jgi:hypothetical protein